MWTLSCQFNFDFSFDLYVIFFFFEGAVMNIYFLKAAELLSFNVHIND